MEETSLIFFGGLLSEVFFDPPVAAAAVLNMAVAAFTLAPAESVGSAVVMIGSEYLTFFSLKKSSLIRCSRAARFALSSASALWLALHGSRFSSSLTTKLICFSYSAGVAVSLV